MNTTHTGKPVILKQSSTLGKMSGKNAVIVREYRKHETGMAFILRFDDGKRAVIHENWFAS